VKSVNGSALKLGPALLVQAGLFLLLATAAIGTSADADLWGHLRFGQDILRTGSITHPDEYSFTTDRPWTNHEWLTEISFAWAYALAGTTGLVLLKLSVIVAVVAIVWWHVARVTPTINATMWFVALAFVGTYWRTHSIRPQLFSVLFFAVFVVVMARADSGKRGGLWLLPFVMALWVNFHGGWIVGLGVFGFWTAVRVLNWPSSITSLGEAPPPPRSRSAPLLRRGLRGDFFIAAMGLLTLAATLANPYGIELWQFLLETVRFERSDIQEWGSILEHPFLVGIPWALVALAAVIAIVRGGWPRRLDYVVIVFLTAIASSRVSRLDAFFALAAVVLLAPQMARAWESFGQRRRPPATEEPLVEAESPASRGVEPQAVGVIVITLAALAVMLVPAVRIMSPYVGCVTIAGTWVPDVEASQFISANRLRGRMLMWFDWGEYAIWHFGPDLKVSMDGRRETVYSDRLIQAHRRFYAADESAAAFLAELNPDFVWVARRLPIADKLSGMGQQQIFANATSAIFARAGLGPFVPATGNAVSPRCFPGP
jgi:hypothetical protein